jgi:hypothetical protein
MKMMAILFTGNLLLLAVRSDPDAGWTPRRHGYFTYTSSHFSGGMFRGFFLCRTRHSDQGGGIIIGAITQNYTSKIRGCGSPQPYFTGGQEGFEPSTS